MSEMVERVARAICKEDGRNPDLVPAMNHGEGNEPRSDVAVPLWRNYCGKAIAAIDAMFPPDMAEVERIWRLNLLAGRHAGEPTS